MSLICRRPLIAGIAAIPATNAAALPAATNAAGVPAVATNATGLPTVRRCRPNVLPGPDLAPKDKKTARQRCSLRTAMRRVSSAEVLRRSACLAADDDADRMIFLYAS